MNEAGIFLSTSFLAKLSAPTRAEILKQMGLESSAKVASENLSHETFDGPTDGPAELTVALVRRLTDGLGAKTMGALRVIAKSDSPEFRLSDVVAATEGAESYRDLRAVWGALTRRTHKILDDAQADLVWWNTQEEFDDDEAYVDHVGRVARLTHQSLRVHFREKP